MTHSHQYSSFPQINADIAVARGVVKTLKQADSNRGLVLDHRVERTGEAVMFLSNYIAYRIDMMNDMLKGEQPSAFVNKLRNRSAALNRACEDLRRTIEPYIKGDDRKQAYMWFTDIVTNALDSLLEDMHRDLPEPTKQVIRRAKLRYHDPYPTDVKERTAAFEDGYCKGYTDAMDDVMREVAELSDDNDTMLSVTIGDDGKINIRKL
jgi:hypothetical protein